MEENAEIGDVTLVVYGSHATVLVIKSYFWWPKQLYSYEELVKLSFGHPEVVWGVKNERK